MRYLAIDLGDKRTGIATGDALTRIASPVAVLEVSAAERHGEALLEAILRTIADFWTPRDQGELVVGLPINMDGTEGPAAKKARDVARVLSERTNRPVHLFDERLTSAEADWRMAQTGLTHAQKKARRDAIAAAAILEGFLNSLSTPTSDAASQPPPSLPADGSSLR
jgi:putative Holliday junction resolvase